jgi:hypothetical protein
MIYTTPTKVLLATTLQPLAGSCQGRWRMEPS